MVDNHLIEKLFIEDGYGFTNEGYYFKIDDLIREKGEIPSLGMRIHLAQITHKYDMKIRIKGVLPKAYGRMVVQKFAKDNYYRAVDLYNVSGRQYVKTVCLAAFKRVKKRVTLTGITFVPPIGGEIIKLKDHELEQITMQLGDPLLFIYKKQVITIPCEIS